MPVRMSLKKFEAVARRAIAGLPKEFQPYVADCMLCIEPYASDELLDEMEVPEDEDIYGLYEGAALTERRHDDFPQMPPRIILYYEPLMADCETEAELVREIQLTVVHEVGHHFGLDERRLEELGFE